MSSCQLRQPPPEAIGVLHNTYVLTEAKDTVPSKSPLNEEENLFVQQIIKDIYGFKTKNLRFPAKQPKSIAKKDIQSIQANKYFVSPKSDGIRYMLLLTYIKEQPKAVMIDRALNMYEIEVWANRHYFDNTLLDGELVWKSKSLSFLIFDCIQCKGKYTANLEYEQRIQIIHNSIINDVQHVQKNKLEEYIAEEDKIYANNNFKNLNLDTKKIQIANKDNVLNINKNAKHPVDGIIFTPNIGDNIFKFKTIHTIDVLIHKNLKVAVNQNDKNIILENITIEESILYIRIIQNNIIEWMQYENNKEHIIECTIEIQNNFVHIFPIKIRYDKMQPNNINTVIQTIKNIQENISLEQIAGDTPVHNA